MKGLRQLWVSSLLTASLANAQFPLTPQGITTKQISSHPGVSISYKQTTICETKAKAWAGYVHMPSSYLSPIETAEPYNISTFFWYFEARQNPQNAPTAIYLAGGPGESSVYGAVLDGGPCYINPDSNSTTENPWSMTNQVNMLYIDQPVGAGFSYNELVKSTLDLTFHANFGINTTEIVAFDEWEGGVPAQNTTFLHGILPSQNPSHTANTTGVAAVTLWLFSQVWFADFPEYTTTNKQVNMFGNSYGGYWVTGSAAYFQKQNVKIQSGNMSGTVIELGTIGFTNGCVDQLYQAPWYAQQAYSNVYDYPLINKTVLELAEHTWSKSKGCQELILDCRKLGDELDPDGFGINAKVNEICLDATLQCIPIIESFYQPPFSIPSVGIRSEFDMAHLEPDPFPPSYLLGFFNQAWVQQDLGVPVNFTGDSNLLGYYVITAAGDSVRRAGMLDVEYLLDAGVKVNFVYGDRDMRCPWLGMEKLSLAANWTGAEQFREAGYAKIETNASYDGGVVRQHGNLAFSRVFEAGHDAYVYQPETVSEIFTRAIFDMDIATGTISTSSGNYSSSGPSSSDKITLTLPPPPPPNCNLWAMQPTCTEDQLAAVEAGTAEIVDFTVVKPSGGGGVIPSVAEGATGGNSSSGAAAGNGTSSSGGSTSTSGATGLRGSGLEQGMGFLWVLLAGWMVLM